MSSLDSTLYTRRQVFEKGGHIMRLMICALALFMYGCQSPPDTQTPTEPLYNFVESTLYYADRTSSISMLAAFSRASSTMEQGYKFQFRTINSRAVFLDSISIIAGGKRIFLEENQIVLPPERGITLELSLDDTLFVSKFPTALLQFRQNNVSYLYVIELHQLKEFTP